MAFEHHTHTADVKLSASADSLEGAFSEAARGFSAILTDDSIADTSVFSVELTAESKEALFFEFLDYLVFLLDTQGFVPSFLDGEILDLSSQWVLDGVVHGDSISQYDHSGDIKAPTYHELAVEQSDGQWIVSAVLDL